MSDTNETPRHLRTPGDDGYRTPTIEDAETALSIHDAGIDPYPSMRIRHVHTSALESLQDPALRPTGDVDKRRLDEAAQGSRFLRRTSSDSTIRNLTWKQRIRHVTWASFTLTMATGGIANALHAGKSRGAVYCGVLLLLSKQAD